MCLAVPGRVMEVYNQRDQALVDVLGLQRLVGIQLVGELSPGDYVLVHAGYALEKLDLQAAQEQIRLWEEILSHELESTKRSGPD